MGLVYKDVGIIDLDGSVVVQENLLLTYKPKIIKLSREPNLKIWTSLADYQSICQKLGETALGINFLGMGEFHHLTYHLIKNNPAQELAVVVFDNHPDFLPTFPGFISCGSWLLNVAMLTKVKQIIVVGVTELSGLQNLDSALSFAKFTLLVPKSKKIKTAKVQVKYYEESELLTTLEKSLNISEVYISIDKDVLHPLDSLTTWEQGELRLNQLITVLTMLRTKFKIWGVDVTGEYGSMLYKIQRIGEKKATTLNEKANLLILDALFRGE